MRTWNNGENAQVVKTIIDGNFKAVAQYMPYQMLAIPTSIRLSLSKEYLSNGLMVFDTTLNSWYRYTNGSWVGFLFPYTVEHYERSISSDDWIDGTITISSMEHKMTDPVVQLYYKISDTKYESVYGGVEIDENNNVILNSDLSFNGKVVIK